MSLKAVSNLPSIVYYARRSRELGKLANVRKGEEAANALREKIAADAVLVEEVEKLASGLMRAFEGMKNLGPIGKGLAMGTAAAVPLGLTGYFMTNRAENKGRDLLKAGLGAAAVGAAAYGLGRMGSSSAGQKMAGEETGSPFNKEAAASYKAIQAIRSVIDSAEDAETAKLATETLMVANGHLADIVSNAVLSDETGMSKVANAPLA